MTEKESTSFLKKISRASLTASGGLGLFIIEAGKVIILAGVTIFLVRYFLFKPFYVKGASMEPNFYSQEYLIIDELTYRFHEPKRGEVIVFKYSNTPKEFFLKRIIGLPGERVKVSDGKVVIYNTDHPEGVQIQESYLPTDLETIGEKNTVLGDRQYFVMGDNRPNSYDSRRFGPIDQSAIVGRVIFRGWPFGRIQKFNTPDFKIGVEEENKK